MRCGRRRSLVVLNWGDARRTARLVQLAQQLSSRPQSSLPCALSDAAALKAAYRFFDNPEVSAGAILDSHVQATRERAAQVPLVLVLVPQDTTFVDWSTHLKTQGLGPLSHAHTRGLVVHSTLAVVPEGVPLGLLDQQVWARREDNYARLPAARTRALEDKESHKWVRSLQQVNAARRACPHTRFGLSGTKRRWRTRSDHALAGL